MGGIGSGGARPGAGRKSKRLAEKVLHGTASARERKAAVRPVEEFDAPDDLTTEERLVWLRLAPFAFKAQTLTPAMADAFSDLCRNRVLARELAANPDKRGGADHRGLIQRVESQMRAFCLSPMGKPLMDSAPKPDDPFAAFDGPIN